MIARFLLPGRDKRRNLIVVHHARASARSAFEFADLRAPEQIFFAGGHFLVTAGHLFAGALIQLIDTFLSVGNTELSHAIGIFPMQRLAWSFAIAIVLPFAFLGGVGR